MPAFYVDDPACLPTFYVGNIACLPTFLEAFREVTAGRNFGIGIAGRIFSHSSPIQQSQYKITRTVTVNAEHEGHSIRRKIGKVGFPKLWLAVNFL